MNFKDFLANLQSVRDYDEKPLKSLIVADIKIFLDKINAESAAGLILERCLTT